MLCHRDKTFCVADCVHNVPGSACGRSLERERHTLGETAELPVAQADFSRDCLNFYPAADGA